MPAQSNGSLMSPLQLGVVVVLVLLVVVTVAVVTEVVVGHLSHSAGHITVAIACSSASGSQSERVIVLPQSENWSRTPLQFGAVVVVEQLPHSIGHTPLAILPKAPESKQSI